MDGNTYENKPFLESIKYQDTQSNKQIRRIYI